MSRQEQRAQALKDWVLKIRPDAGEPTLISGDASFRRYFRLQDQGIPLIAVDAPPETEKNHQFINVARQLEVAGLLAPRVLASELEQGFLLLTDLGQTHLADTLAADNFRQQYQQAMAVLLQFQQNFDASSLTLPRFDRDFMAIENAILPEWLAVAHLGQPWGEAEQRTWQEAMDWLSREIESQPYGVMHRDYHSRNLMWQHDSLALIDFQDMVTGPVTYDLVSLLRDCYQSWPESDVRAMALEYGQQRMGEQFDPETWMRWFDLTGLQRHLKAAGIFARLWHRDQKPGYLPWIGPTLDYVREVTQRYGELAELDALVSERLIEPLNRIQHGDTA